MYYMYSEQAVYTMVCLWEDYEPERRRRAVERLNMPSSFHRVTVVPHAVHPVLDRGRGRGLQRRPPLHHNLRTPNV